MCIIIIFLQINATDNNGVIEGLWSSNIGTGGRSPTMWSGSVSILKQYIKNAQETKGDKPQPVKYGHCYVFAGLMTTSKFYNNNYIIMTQTLINKWVLWQSSVKAKIKF